MVLVAVAGLAYQMSSTHDAAAADRVGVASVYSTESGSKTASGQKLNPQALTAAHRTLPFGTKVTVTNKHNGRSVVVTINAVPSCAVASSTLRPRRRGSSASPDSPR